MNRLKFISIAEMALSLSEIITAEAGEELERALSVKLLCLE
jgi:hypothetical protein